MDSLINYKISMYNQLPIKDKRDLFGVKFLWQGATHLLLWFSVYVHVRERFVVNVVNIRLTQFLNS